MLFIEFIEFSQKLFVLTVIFAALTKGRFFTLSFCFFDEAWRPLSGKTSINLRKNISPYFTGRTSKKKVQFS